MDKILELLNVPVLMEPDRFAGFIAGYRSLQHLPRASEGEKQPRKISIDGATLLVDMNGGYAVTAGGMAVIGVTGPMYKGYGCYGWADQSELRSCVREAASDPNVGGIMMIIDSPGGSVAGTSDLAAEIRAASSAKPTLAYCEDCACSAAYWTAASCNMVYSNGGMVGSIGVVTALVDSSKYFENAGIKVIPIVTGKMKGVGMEGVPITPEQVQYIQDLIDTMYSDFVNAVSTARGMRAETVRKMEAKVFMGQQAVDNKLIDGVCSIDKAAAILAKEMKSTGGNRRAKALLQIEEMRG